MRDDGRPAEELLREGIALLGVPDPERVNALLCGFLGELERWNARFGFVKADSVADLVIKHVLDSLSAWRAVDGHARAGSVLDVGSGAGFPGIPLAIALPEASFTLLERSAKKASFLRNCVILLGLANVAVSQTELSRVSGFFDVVTFRAVAPLDRFVAQAAGGRLGFGAIVAYKGRESRVREEIARIRETAGARFAAEILSLQVPFLGEERCLAILRAASWEGPASHY
jgi:16S rRNA (guanine527-N7)-methyltransferase